MAGEQMDVPEGRSPDWRRGSLATVGASSPPALLVALMLMVARTNDARDQRSLPSGTATTHAVTLPSMPPSPAPKRRSSATCSTSCRAPGDLLQRMALAGQQIGELRPAGAPGSGPARQGRAALAGLFGARPRARPPVARRAASEGSDAVTYFHMAGKSASAPTFEPSSQASRPPSATICAAGWPEPVNRATSRRVAGWLGWLAVLIGIGALGSLCRVPAMWRAARCAARGRRRSEPAQRLDEAVQERTAELVEANQRLQAKRRARRRGGALSPVQKMEAVGQLTGGNRPRLQQHAGGVVGGLDLARRKLTDRGARSSSISTMRWRARHRAAALTGACSPSRAPSRC